LDNVINTLLDDAKIPKMAKIRQTFLKSKIDDIAKTVSDELYRPEIISTIKPGQSIAIAVGSRGIANIAIIIKETVKIVKDLGGQPFIIPAMGSHGGATAEGQREILASFGIVEQYVGAPIKSSLEVVKIGETPNGKPVFIDKYASEADGIIVVNRIKPHTGFRSKYESGIVKMMAVGLGKQKGAEVCHSDGIDNIAENIYQYANIIAEKFNILFALAIVENPYDETYKVASLTLKEIYEKEPGMLEEAKGLLPRIKFNNIDVLIVDQIGKNIAGSGMDPNITGLFSENGPKVQRIVVLDLTRETHGNANGIGVADFTTKRLFNKMDLNNTYPNAITSTVVDRVKIPMILDNDRQAIMAAIKTCNCIDKENPRIVRLKDTLHLSEIYISEALLDEAQKNNEIEIIEEAKELVFDKFENLL